MDDFSYLSVLLSIVLGLGIANLLTGLAALVRRRGAYQPYWPVPVWIVTLFLIHVQTWWSMFGFRDHRDWSFAGFLLVLLQPVYLFLMSALIVPAIPEDGKGFDLKAAYFRESRWLFAVQFLVLGNSIAKDLVLSGRWPAPANLAAHGVLAAFSLIGFFWRTDLVHKVLAPAVLAFIVVYIAVLFTNLT